MFLKTNILFGTSFYNKERFSFTAEDIGGMIFYFCLVLTLRKYYKNVCNEVVTIDFRKFYRVNENTAKLRG